VRRESLALNAGKLRSSSCERSSTRETETSESGRLNVDIFAELKRLWEGKHCFERRCKRLSMRGLVGGYAGLGQSKALRK